VLGVDEVMKFIEDKDVELLVSIALVVAKVRVLKLISDVELEVVTSTTEVLSDCVIAVELGEMEEGDFVEDIIIA
jgi:hypothetical protein